MYSKNIFDIINRFYVQNYVYGIEKCTYGLQCQFLHWEGQIGLCICIISIKGVSDGKKKIVLRL